MVLVGAPVGCLLAYNSGAVWTLVRKRRPEENPAKRQNLLPETGEPSGKVNLCDHRGNDNKTTVCTLSDRRFGQQLQVNLKSLKFQVGIVSSPSHWWCAISLSFGKMSGHTPTRQSMLAIHELLEKCCCEKHSMALTQDDCGVRTESTPQEPRLSWGREIRTYWVEESIPICPEFSTMKTLANFPNVSSVNALLQWWRSLKRLGKYQNFSVCWIQGKWTSTLSLSKMTVTSCFYSYPWLIKMENIDKWKAQPETALTSIYYVHRPEENREHFFPSTQWLDMLDVMAALLMHRNWYVHMHALHISRNVGHQKADAGLVQATAWTLTNVLSLSISGRSQHRAALRTCQKSTGFRLGFSHFSNFSDYFSRSTCS